jgi:hypothetical protein
MPSFRIQNLADRRYIKSMIAGTVRRREFRFIHTFLFFIGYQRSGHSFIGSLIDAHPNACMGMEVDALHLVELGYGRDQLYYCLVRNSEIFHKILKNEWTGYSYAVPGQYQGSYKKLFLIGDKKGGKSTLRLAEDLSLYDQLIKRVKCKVKILHVVRHPLDNISTMVLRNLDDLNSDLHHEIRKRMEIYFQKASINKSLLESGIMDVMTVYHEAFIQDPYKELSGILDFIGLPREENYLRACESRVYKIPHMSRNELKWPDELIDEVKQRMTHYPFLKKYLDDE